MTSQSRVVFTGIVVVVAALSSPAGASRAHASARGCDSHARLFGNLIASTDAPANIAEGNETNNTREGVVQIGSDLSVSALSAPSRAAVGSAIVVTDTTRNPGGCGADASVTAFYLSANSTLDATDVRLAPARAVGPLDAGASSAGTSNVIIPEIAPGAWFLIANADDDEMVNEMAESNNRRIVSMHIGPDFDLTSLSAPATATAGSTILVTDGVKNVGLGTAGASATRYYLSLNTSLDASDILLDAERVAPALDANATSTGSASVTLPVGLTGRYYVIAVADGTNVVAESNETNNALARVITINP